MFLLTHGSTPFSLTMLSDGLYSVVCSDSKQKDKCGITHNAHCAYSVILLLYLFSSLGRLASIMSNKCHDHKVLSLVIQATQDEVTDELLVMPGCAYQQNVQGTTWIPICLLVSTDMLIKFYANVFIMDCLVVVISRMASTEFLLGPTHWILGTIFMYYNG